MNPAHAIDPQEATHPAPALVCRYILADRRMEPAYLYGHSRVVATVGTCLVIETQAEDVRTVEFLARYQLNRLASGLRAASQTVYPDEDVARRAAGGL